jgi:hypothetical protein
MFVMERGDALWLAPFVPTQWMEDGRSVEVRDAPTFFGEVGFAITSRVGEGFIGAEIAPPQREVPREIVLRLRHPQGKALAGAEVRGAKDFKVVPEDSTVHLTPGKEKITVRARYAG